MCARFSDVSAKCTCPSTCLDAFPQCSRVKYKGDIWHFQESLLQAAALDLFLWTALFWKNHCIVIFYYACDPLESPTIASPSGTLLPFSVPPLPPLAALVHRPRPLKAQLPSSPLSVPSLLLHLTQTADPQRPPPPLLLPWSTYFQLFFMLKKTVV